MDTDALVRLQYAVAATRYGGGQKIMAMRVRGTGVRAFEDVVSALQLEVRRSIEEQARELLDRGVDAILLGQPGFPEHLASVSSGAGSSIH